jgi:hypothetical protein
LIDTSASAEQLGHHSRIVDQVVGCPESPSPFQAIQSNNLSLTATQPSAQHPTVLLKPASSFTNTSSDNFSCHVKPILGSNPSYNNKDESAILGPIFVHKTVPQPSLPLDSLHFPGNGGVAVANVFFLQNSRGGNIAVLSHDNTEDTSFAFSGSSSADGQSYPNYQPCASPAEQLQQMANYPSPESSILSSGLFHPILDLSDEVRYLLVSEIIMSVKLSYLLLQKPDTDMPNMRPFRVTN